MPMEPVIMEASSERMSPNMFSVTMTSNSLYSDIFQRAFGLCEKENFAGTVGQLSGRRGANFMETQIGFTSMGIPHGAISATLNHPEDTVPCSVFPEDIIYSTVDFDRRHVKLLFALRDKHLSFMMSTFSPMIHDMIVYLQLHWQELCGDLEAGRIGDQVSVDPRMRARLNAILTPDPERAEEIRRVMQEQPYTQVLIYFHLIVPHL